MAFNSGLGSAIQGFGKGYLSALQFGERQKQGYMNTKLKQDDLTFRKNQALSDAAFKQFQIRDAIEAAQERRDNAKLTAQDREKALRNQAGIAASNALNEDLKMISGLQGPDQIRAWNTARARQTQILGDVLTPEELQKHLENTLPQPGAPIPGMTQQGFVAGAPMGDSRLLDVGKFESAQGPLEPGKPRTFQDPTNNTFTQVGRSPFDPRADAARRVMSAGLGGFNPANMGQLGAAISSMYQPAASGIPSSQSDFGYEQGLKPEVGQVPVIANYKLGAIDQANIDAKNVGTETKKFNLGVLQENRPQIISQAALKTKTMVEGLNDKIFNREYKKNLMEINTAKLQLAQMLGNASIKINNAKLAQGDKRLAIAETMAQIKAAYDPLRMAQATELSSSRLRETASKLPTNSQQYVDIQKTLQALQKDKQRFLALHFMSADQTGVMMDNMAGLMSDGMTEDAAFEKLLGFAPNGTVAGNAFIPVANPQYTGRRNNIDRNTYSPGTNPSAKKAATYMDAQRAGNPLNLPGGVHAGPGAQRPQTRQHGR